MLTCYALNYAGIFDRGLARTLTLNLKKCEAFWPSGDYTFQNFSPKVCHPLQVFDSVELLGTPIYG